MGDYFGPPEKLEEHNQALYTWFRYCLCGLILSITLGIWWGKRIFETLANYEIKLRS